MTSGSGGASSVGTATSAGGSLSAGGSQLGGTAPAGGMTAVGGKSATGSAATTGGAATGGKSATGGAAAGGAATGGAATGGKSATGGAAAGGKSATGGAASAGATATTTTTAGATSTGTGEVDCNATMPTTGGTTKTGTNVNGTVNGLNYGIWTNGSGGSITVFPDAHAFSTSWDESADFLAHLGLDFRTAKSYKDYGTILAQFVELKSGTAGGFSMIGVYGWTHSPCVEWYINEDSYKGLYGRGNVTATIDGDTYYLSTTTTTGTGGANACESGHTGSWTQMVSTRKTARQCGTVTVSDHFVAWEKQGWTLGTLSSVHINIEVGGGTGSIQFPVANVTTSIK
ncbi:MAG TPA: glycoside hydrolase family 11 protein [Polyangiaceae bacterium]